MKITPVNSPIAIAPQGTPEHVRTAKAVAAFNKGQSSYDKPVEAVPQQSRQPEAHSINPNSVSVEELSAIQAPQIDKGVNNEQVAIEETQELSQPEEVKTKAVDPALSRQFAQLARQEKALRAKVQQQDQALKAREQALAVREAKFSEPQQPQFDASKYVSLEDFKANPLKVMAQTGLSYDELTQQLLNVSTTDPRTEALIGRLEAKIKALEDGAEDTKKSYAETQQQTYNAAVKQIEYDARDLVQMDPNFETIKATNSVKDVVELITRTHAKTGKILSVEEACNKVEEYLVDEALKLTRIGKIKSRLEQSSAVKVQTQKQPPKPLDRQIQPGMKTLTNAASSTRQLSAKERAVLAFKGELKS